MVQTRPDARFPPFPPMVVGDRDQDRSVAPPFPPMVVGDRVQDRSVALTFSNKDSPYHPPDLPL